MKLQIDFLLIAQNQKEVEVMKKLLMAALILLINIAFVSTGFAFSKAPPEKATQEKVSQEKAPAPEKASAAEKVPAKKRPAKPKASGFVGKVTMVDANLIQVKGKGGSVTFDASNPEFRGYRDIGDVIAGDTVAAKYTKDGIMVTKLKGAALEKMAEKAKKALRKIVVSRTNCTGTSPCTVSVDKRTVEDYKLKVINKSKEGGSGMVTSAPAGISCSTGSFIGCEDFFVYIEKVTLSASADTGSTFIGWRPVSKCPGVGDCAVTIDRKQTITAVFTKP